MSAMIPRDPGRQERESIVVRRRVYMKANGGDTKKSQEGCVRAWIGGFASRDTADINSLS
jgi:hypothetical protein